MNSIVLVIMFFWVLKSFSIMTETISYSSSVSRSQDTRKFKSSIQQQYMQQLHQRKCRRKIYINNFLHLAVFVLLVCSAWCTYACRKKKTAQVICLCSSRSICSYIQGTQGREKQGESSSQGNENTWLPPANLPQIPTCALPYHCQIL